MTLISPRSPKGDTLPEPREAMVLRWYPKNDTVLRYRGGLYRFSGLYCFCTALITRSAKATRHDFSLIQPNSRTGKSYPLFQDVREGGFSGCQTPSVYDGESPKVYYANEAG
jgi:hypothetical protein